MTHDNFDALIIGGGINGAGIAAHFAERGLSVALLELADFASGTSSASTKLIHGGLRYLEQYEFGLVHKALKEREILLAKAPHLVSTLRFVIPHTKTQRPFWLVRLGLWCYDHLAKRMSIPGSGSLDFANAEEGQPLQKSYQRGLFYYDCQVDDSRLVIANLQAAQAAGASVYNYHKVLKATPKGAGWHVMAKNQFTSETLHFQSKLLINATGPWVKQIYDDVLHQPCPYDMQLVQGSHIVLPRFYEGNHAYLLQDSDGRVVFVIPHHANTIRVGTTEQSFIGDPSKVHIADDEINDLLQILNSYFKVQFSPQDILHTWSGVRPLMDDGHKDTRTMSRDYLLHLDEAPAALLTVFGGKLTTYRVLAEEAGKKIAHLFPRIKALPAAATPLPGGNLPGSWTDWLQAQAQKYPFLPAHLLKRYAHQYGTCMDTWLSDVHTLADLGPLLAPDLYQAEVSYLKTHEWAKTMDDILWRRTKLGLINACKHIS